ncbi:MAG: hypothetical protein ACUVRK_13635 [Spirochaetota bacterium]
MKHKVDPVEFFLMLVAIPSIWAFYYVITDLLQNLVGTVITALLLCGSLAYCKMRTYKDTKDIYIACAERFLHEKEVIVNLNELQKHKKEYMHNFTMIADDYKMTSDINPHGGE